MRRIYLDSAPIIYLFEGAEELRDSVREHLEKLQGSDSFIVSSEIGRLECRIKPIAERDESLLELYDAFFAGREVIVVCPDQEIWERATQIRVTYGFRIPDALHLACALENECEIFLTNDHRLQRCTEIQVQVIT